MPTIRIGTDDVVVKRSGAWIHVAGEVDVNVDAAVNPRATYNFIIDLGSDVSVDEYPCIAAIPTRARSQNISHFEVQANIAGSNAFGSTLTMRPQHNTVFGNLRKFYHFFH
tara:strand:- start:140 stop:472 length:333 start_codon:yes stop_codon:yes gene_type:complete